MKTIVTKKMWYGLNATVILGPGFLHRAGYGLLLLPHPPLVNSLLRYGLPEDAQERLSIIHEFAHLKTASFALPYTALVFYLAYSLIGSLDWMTIVVLILSTHAAWEMLAETATIIESGHIYGNIYKHTPITPRLLFWGITTLLTLWGWYIILM